MTKILPFVLAAAMLAAMPINAMAAVQVANSGASAYCGDGGDEAYKRPGGFCDQLDDMKSMPTNTTDEGCSYKVVDAAGLVPGRMLVAGAYNPCCSYGSLIDEIPADGIAVALIDPCAQQ